MVSRLANPPIRQPDRFFIGGEWAAPSSKSKIDVFYSASGDPYTTVAEAQAADIDRAVAAARDAFDNGPWPQLSHHERAKYLRAIAQEVRERTEDFAQIWSCESGNLYTHGLGGAAFQARLWDYYADLADTYPWVERHRPTAGEVGLLVREPVGVCAAITAWNAPFAQITNKMAPALLAGCTFIIKSPSDAPSSGYVFGEIAEKIGLPPGVVNVVTADREVSELLVRHPDVDKITFTGSTAAGKRIAAACGERMARCTMELGGKSAAVIFDDFDIELAAETIGKFAIGLAGQACSSLTRIVVSRHRHGALVEALGSKLGSVRVGDPFDPDSQMGPLSHQRQHSRVLGYIAKGLEEGATLATGGKRPAHLERGCFVEPTVFGNVARNATIAREEIFGPVLSVIPAENEDNAIEIANDTIYGLNNSIFTNDIDRAYAVARKLKSGTVGHNSFRSDFLIGFGGYKQSGIGREGGVEGLLPFLESKTIILDGLPSALAGLTRIQS